MAELPMANQQYAVVVDQGQKCYTMDRIKKLLECFTCGKRCSRKLTDEEFQQLLAHVRLDEYQFRYCRNLKQVLGLIAWHVNQIAPDIVVNLSPSVMSSTQHPTFQLNSW